MSQQNLHQTAADHTSAPLTRGHGHGDKHVCSTVRLPPTQKEKGRAVEAPRLYQPMYKLWI